jgi:hypothetical protein
VSEQKNYHNLSPLDPECMAELTEGEMAAISGGVVLRRLTLNRWLLKFRTNTLKLATVQARVTNDILGDSVNRQASLDLSSTYHRQLAELRGNRRLSDRFFQALGLPTPL